MKNEPDRCALFHFQYRCERTGVHRVHVVTDDNRDKHEWVADTAHTITDEQIRELFAKHCECRPLDTERASHSHDCDTAITEVCRTALGGSPLWPDCMRKARARCAALINTRAKEARRG